MNNIINSTIQHIGNKLKNDASGHDWWHIYRVHNLAKYIAVKEGGNIFVVELAALLHDISDWKLNGGDDQLGGELAEEWLASLALDTQTIQHVSDIIRTMSFKGANVEDNMKTLEGKIVQDADRLDAIGAIGIARAFAYGGNKQRLMYDPDVPYRLHDTFEEYKKSNSNTINHFYEKLLFLKDRMNTATARKIAEERHLIMEQFLQQFFKEWDFNN